MTVNPIERNDVDLSRLLSWRRKFTIMDTKNEPFDVFIRLVGDAEVNQSRVYAIRQSNEYRRKLRDSNSDEHITYIPEMSELTKEQLIESVLSYSMREFTEQARDDAKLPEPKELSGSATLEDQEKYQAEVDSYPARQQEHLKTYVEKLIDKKRKELGKLSEEKIYSSLVSLLIDHLCENRMLEAFRDMTTYLGTYSDPDYKVKLFESISDFIDLPSEIKRQLIDKYNILELGLDELKN